MPRVIRTHDPSVRAGKALDRAATVIGVLMELL
jgi:hypothetical protein